MFTLSALPTPQNYLNLFAWDMKNGYGLKSTFYFAQDSNNNPKDLFRIAGGPNGKGLDGVLDEILKAESIKTMILYDVPKNLKASNPELRGLTQSELAILPYIAMSRNQRPRESGLID